jgi:ABC-2 type transport system permease protein
MIKRQGKKTLSFALGMALYNFLLIGVFPSLSKSEGIARLSDNLPKLGKLFGVASGGGLDRFEAYVSSQCFGQVWLLVMGIYTICSADELIAQLVDNGSMAYLLSSPAGRLKVFTTQTAVLLSGLILMILLTELAIWGEMSVFNISLERWPSFPLGVLGLALFLTIGSYSFLFSALFNDEESVVLWASGLTFLYYVLDVLSGLDERFASFKDLTIFGFFRPQQVLEGEMPVKQTFSLFGLSMVFLITAGYIFTKKDLVI